MDAEQCPRTGEQHVIGSSEDLARGLFSNVNHALAGVVRDLQLRSKRAVQAKTPQPFHADGNAVCEPGAGSVCALVADNDVEKGDLAGLWVVGGGTTVGGTLYQEAAAKPKPGVTVVGPNTATEQLAETAPAAGNSDKDGEGDGEEQRPREQSCPGRLHSCCSSTLDACKDALCVVRVYRTTVIVPAAVFMLLAALGVWGVIAGAQSTVQQRKDDVRSRAVDAATGFQIQLQQSFTPGLTFTLLVKQQPDVGFWFTNFGSTAQELMSRVPNGSLYNFNLQPFAQNMMIYPMRPADYAQINPPRDLLSDPTRRADILKTIQTKEPLVVGPITLSTGSIGAFVRYPIYVGDVGANETFGFRYRDNATAIPYSDLPASVRSCSVCYNAATREKWWGLMTVLIDYNSVALGTDAYLSGLRTLGFHYALVRPVNDTYEQVIAQVGDSSLKHEDVVMVEVKVLNGVWYLRVAPANGFKVAWQAPLIAAVVAIAFIMSLLLFVAMALFKRQRLLLQETVAANRDLAETTRRLEEEKERMDVLLVRQYDLLRCLDANRGERPSEMTDTVSVSKKAMMARIEDARRSLNVVKTSVEDPIQVFEVLGAGAFGKVQKGLWRGTVVAVKTMILPANMTGQQKREKMAVMEAAISSSLVHPNIVTTYTYFIRPYHEPTHEGVQQMAVSSRTACGGQDGSSPGGELQASSAGSSNTESIVHSFEVRLVLEFCDKGSLKDALDQDAFMQGGTLNYAAMLETAADIAKAMVHMHAANVLHSDLKARNIMLKSSGTEGRGVTAKVADFGLSTRMEHQETHLSACFQGTLTHMAPEVMLEGRISKAADVYSFGILLWELFCAADPFAGVPRAHMGHAITKEARRPRFPPFAPRSYVDLASRCWDPDASARPSFEQVLTELVRIREEMGGDTPPLVIAPPKPSPPQTADALSWIAKASAASHHGNGGVVVGSGSVGASSAPMTGGSCTGSAIVIGGCDGSSGSSSGMPGLGTSPQAHGSSSLGRRRRNKALLAQRYLRKNGIHVGGSGSSRLAQTLPALCEEAEHRDG
ncbi:hypothetical protein Agub_g9161 [Astrephomene gubernaculifera]|uniref:Protein kinase domain-containing protein n=1 Tax=Astrephomene gubernaculifera TaxID=47775 RepID=A0AAD3DVL1_9CHLO|nr:hypothetical protein Agub_g9161 [Astrephomene gubernaculifera]